MKSSVRKTLALVLMGCLFNQTIGAGPLAAATVEIQPNLFAEQALIPRAAWVLTPIGAAATIWCYRSAGTLSAIETAREALVPLLSHAAALGVTAVFASAVLFPWSWQGKAEMGIKPIPRDPRLLRAIQTTWLVGGGDYGKRRVSANAYPFLMTPIEEIRVLVKYLKENASGSGARAEKRELQELQVTAERDLSTEKMTELISLLRRRVLAHQISTPDGYQEWAAAVSLINRKLGALEDRWGRPFRLRVEDMILQLEMYLPFLSELHDDPNQGYKHDHFKLYVLDTEHGLAHSLDAMVQPLQMIDENPALDEATRQMLLENAKLIYSGVGLYHDLTGLRDRKDHHRSAAALVNAILPQIRTAEGFAYHSPEEIGLIAHGCLTHRGQNFDPPTSLLEEYFVDGDEFLLVKDILRVFKQPAAGGIFAPAFWNVYRRYVMREDPKRGSAEENGETSRNVHETPYADLFTYGAFTLVMRTLLQNYRTQVARDLVSSTYPALKRSVLHELEYYLRRRALQQNQTLWEVRDHVRRFRRVIRELEGLIHQDPAARERLRTEIGTPEEFTETLRQYLTEYHDASDLPPTLSRARELFDLAVLNEKGDPLPRSSAHVREHRSFQRGLSVFDHYLENPWLNLQKALRTRHASDYLFAGFAFGIYLAARDRIWDLWRMVQENPDRTIPDGLDWAVAHSIADMFLTKVHTGVSRHRAIETVRNQLEVFDYKTAEPLIFERRAPFESREHERIKEYPTSNMHLHGVYALSFEQIAELCRNNREEVHLPSAPDWFDPTKPGHWRQFAFGDGMDPDGDFERPFVLPKELFANDKNFVIHYEAYKQMVINAHAEGNHLVAVTSTFDAFKDNPRLFKRAVKAAIKGLEAGEISTGGNTRGVLILGLRKTYSAEETDAVVDRWLHLKTDWSRAHGDDAERLFGIDSIGEETDAWTFGRLRKTYVKARKEGLWTKVHVGEMWPAGGLLQALQRLQTVVESRLVDQITNPIALFVRLDPNRTDLYTPARQQAIKELQDQLIRTLKDNGIIIEISPTSNDFNSREVRTLEGSNVIPIVEMMQRIPMLVFSDDDPGLYDTRYAEEYLRVFQGKTIYGARMSKRQLYSLLKNSYWVLERIRIRNPRLNVLAVPEPANGNGTNHSKGNNTRLAGFGAFGFSAFDPGAYGAALSEFPGWDVAGWFAGLSLLGILGLIAYKKGYLPNPARLLLRAA